MYSDILYGKVLYKDCSNYNPYSSKKTITYNTIAHIKVYNYIDSNTFSIEYELNKENLQLQNIIDNNSMLYFGMSDLLRRALVKTANSK